MVLWSGPTDPLTVYCLDAVVRTGSWSGALLRGAKLELSSEGPSAVVRPEDTDPVSWSSSSRWLKLTQVESRKKLALDLREWARNFRALCEVEGSRGVDEGRPGGCLGEGVDRPSTSGRTRFPRPYLLGQRREGEVVLPRCPPR